MEEKRRVCFVDTNIFVDLDNGGVGNHLFELEYQFSSTDLALYEATSIDEQTRCHPNLSVRSFSAEEMKALFQMRSRIPTLSVADISLLYVCIEEKVPLLTGDAALRKYAESEGVEVHGLLWVLDEFVASGVLRAGIAAGLLERICNFGSFLPVDECNKRLKKWRESEG